MPRTIKKIKTDTKARWKRNGLILTSQEEFEEIYERYMNSTHCELCDKPYKNSRDRHMDHIHHIDDKWGWFRNVICNGCNSKRADNKINKNNKTGYKLIFKAYDNTCKLGYYYRFRVYINGKRTDIKSSINLDYLVKFRDKWTKENNYYC